MELGDVLVRDSRYVWRRRAARLERLALVLAPASSAPTGETLALALDGGWACEPVVVSAAHPNAVRLTQLRSGREALVDAGTRGRRQLWVELFANARTSAAQSATRPAPDAADGGGTQDPAGPSGAAAEALLPVAGLLVRGEDVERLLAERGSGGAEDAKSAADSASRMLESRVFEPLDACSCGRNHHPFARDQVYRVKHQDALTQFIAEPDAATSSMLALEAPLERRQKSRPGISWSNDPSCHELLKALDRLGDGLTGTKVVQVLLQSGVFNVSTAVVLANRMLQSGLIVQSNANTLSAQIFVMDTSTKYRRGLDLTELDSIPPIDRPSPMTHSAGEIDQLKKQLNCMKSRHELMFRILCGVCFVMALDSWHASVFTSTLKAGVALTLLLLFVLKNATATLAFNVCDSNGAPQLGGMVTAGFFSDNANLREHPTISVAVRKPAEANTGSKSNEPSELKRDAESLQVATAVPVLELAETQRPGILSQVDQAKVLSFRQAMAQSAGVSIEATLVFSDVYLLSVMSVKDRAFRYAVTKMSKILDWRKSYGVERLTLSSVDADVKARLASANMYWHGYDFQNRPILWVRAHLKNWSNMSTNRESEVRAHIFLIELCCRELMPTGVTTFTIVSDASKISTTMVDLRLMHALLDTCVANYPDRIGMVHAGPVNRLLKYLTTALWPFLPTRLRSKVSFIRDSATELSKYMQFDVIPSYLGGPAEHQLSEDDSSSLDLSYMMKAQKDRMAALNM